MCFMLCLLFCIRCSEAKRSYRWRCIGWYWPRHAVQARLIWRCHQVVVFFCNFVQAAFFGCTSVYLLNNFSISALQWLCNADQKSHNPVKRLFKLFTTLYSCLVSFINSLSFPPTSVIIYTVLLNLERSWRLHQCTLGPETWGRVRTPP